MAKATLAGHLHHGAFPFKRVCWTAIFSGAFVALGLSFLFNLFFLAIGLTAFTMSKDGAMAVAVGGAIGLFIAIIVSMLASGYAAGYLGRHFTPERNMGILYGFLTWTLALILSASVVGMFGHYTEVYSREIGINSFRMTHEKNFAVNIDNSQESNKTNTNQVTVSKENLASSAFMIFALFFVGALSTCVGANMGMHCRRDD